MGDAESEDEDFAVDTQEMEEANNSSSDSEGEDQEAEVDIEEEDFTVQVKGGQIQKMKFETIQPVSHMIDGVKWVLQGGFCHVVSKVFNKEEAEAQEEMSQEDESESNLKMLTSDALPENDEGDGDYNPLHDTLR